MSSLLQTLEVAFNKAKSLDCDFEKSRQHQNTQRSKNWIAALTEEFSGKYSEADGYKCFSRTLENPDNDFKIRELLHDICVVKTEIVKSAVKKTLLHYVSETVWQIESELTRDSRAAIIDFSKLVLGSARNKLFIGPNLTRADRVNAYMKMLEEPAKSVTGNLFLAFIPHPDCWDGDTGHEFSLWCFDGMGWQLMSTQ